MEAFKEKPSIHEDEPVLDEEYDEAIAEKEATAEAEPSTIMDIKEKGFWAIADLAKVTGVNKEELYQAYEAAHAAVKEQDPLGNTITASTIWQYYLENRKGEQ